MLNCVDGVIGRIRSRFIATQLDAIEKDLRAKPRRAEVRRGAKMLAACIASSEHVVSKAGGRVQCSACFGSAAIPGARAFLKSPCVPAIESARRFFPRDRRSNVGKEGYPRFAQNQLLKRRWFPLLRDLRRQLQDGAPQVCFPMRRLPLQRRQRRNQPHWPRIGSRLLDRGPRAQRGEAWHP